MVRKAVAYWKLKWNKLAHLSDARTPSTYRVSEPPIHRHWLRVIRVCSGTEVGTKLWHNELYLYVSGDSPYDCPDCDKVCFSQSALTRHRQKLHPDVLKQVTNGKHLKGTTEIYLSGTSPFDFQEMLQWDWEWDCELRATSKRYVGFLKSLQQWQLKPTSRGLDSLPILFYDDQIFRKSVSHLSLSIELSHTFVFRLLCRSQNFNHDVVGWHVYCRMPEGRGLQQTSPRIRRQQLPSFQLLELTVDCKHLGIHGKTTIRLLMVLTNCPLTQQYIVLVSHNLCVVLQESGGQGTWNCPECDKTFKKQFLMKNHLRSHTGESGKSRISGTIIA